MKKVHEILQEALDKKNKKLVKDGKPEISQTNLAEAVFGGTGKNERVKMRNIMTGETERLHPDWVSSLCKELDISPNDLFK